MKMRSRGDRRRNGTEKLAKKLPTILKSSTGKSITLLYVNEFGAKGDGITDDTKVEGSIVAPKDLKVWDGLDARKWLYFLKVRHLTVQGGGTINGMGHNWWATSCKTNTTNAMTFHRCNNLKVRDIRMLNSQQMHISISNSIHVEVSHIIVQAPAKSPNTDGIHISSSTLVAIKDCTIRTGDDCISIVNNSSNILVKNIACGPGHGISIGSLGKSNSWAQVHNVCVDGAYLSNTENGVRIKTWQGGRGYVRKISFTNVWMENVSNPIIIDQYYCDSPLPCPNQVTEGVSNLNLVDSQKKNRIQVSNTKKPLFFYVNLSKRYMQQYNEVELSALGMAISTVVSIAEILKNNGLATEKKIMTSTVDVKEDMRGRPVQKAKIEIVLGKTVNFDELMLAGQNDGNNIQEES
ncbi:Polygalacturonase [Capsicum annuum]|nr:Polygalacturonase [Capsicum annuum]